MKQNHEELYIGTAETQLEEFAKMQKKVCDSVYSIVGKRSI